MKLALSITNTAIQKLIQILTRILYNNIAHA